MDTIRSFYIETFILRLQRRQKGSNYEFSEMRKYIQRNEAYEPRNLLNIESSIEMRHLGRQNPKKLTL